MVIHAYKHYLAFLEKRPKISLPQKTLLTLFALLLVIAGSGSAFFYYVYRKEAPIRLENAYLETASSGLISLDQSLNDLVKGFQVAGVKIEAVDKLKEASAAPSGFYVALDDLDKTIATIETTQKNISFVRQQLTNGSSFAKFANINEGLIVLYDQTWQLLENMAIEHRFAKEFLLASGADFYLPVLTNESLWQEGRNLQIIDYYQNLRSKANETLAKLAKLSPPDKFQEQYSTQIKYLELLVNTSTNIINLLSGAEDSNKENASQLEKSYQVLIGAQRENQEISQRLLNLKLSLVSPKENLEKLAPATLIKNSLKERLSEAIAGQRPLKTSKFPNIIRKYLKLI